MKLNIPALSGIEAIIRQRMAEGHIPGASAAVWVEGEKVYETYAGIAKHDGTPVGPETIFRLASMTKPFTAVAVMQQVEAGRLGLFGIFAHLFKGSFKITSTTWMGTNTAFVLATVKFYRARN